jgi:NAD(P)-dependent dehydrogenase (short-subunit alcohol dehydrogenase family)
VTYGDFCENVGLHLGGYFLVAQQFGLFFREQGHGNIVNMSSIYGAVAPKFEIYKDTPMTMPVEYAAIKAGVNHLTRYMASYFKGSGIRVNCLSPGGIFDSQPDAFLNAYNAHCAGKGMLDPKDMVESLVFLLSDGSKHINGQNLIVDDGFTL